MCNDNFNLTVQSHWIMFCFMVTHFLRGGGGKVLLVSVSKGWFFFFLIQDDQNFGQELQN